MTTKQCTKERHESAKSFFYYFKAVIVFLRFSFPSLSWDPTFSNLELFRERLSEKLHPTIPKGIVGNMGCDQNTFPGIVAVEPTFVAFL